MVKIIPIKPKKKLVDDKLKPKPRGRPEVLKLQAKRFDEKSPSA
jgi:hypothetical protein